MGFMLNGFFAVMMTLMIPLSAEAVEIASFYKDLAPLKPETRILRSTQYFINSPTGIDPLGDGAGVDPKPVFSTKKFDCTTYVETNLALAFSKSQQDVPAELAQIRYQSGTPDFFQRNHFMVSDWIPANTKNGFVTEITGALSQDKSAYHFDKKALNKTIWFFHRVIDLLDHQNKLPQEILTELSKVPVLPSSEERATYLINGYFRDHEERLAKELPDVTIVMFIRNIPSVPTIVNHMGFVVKRCGKLFLNHAPQAKPWKVQEVLLDDYLKDMDSHRAPVDGLLFLRIGNGQAN
jgi:hypothetical protein